MTTLAVTTNRTIGLAKIATCSQWGLAHNKIALVGFLCCGLIWEKKKKKRQIIRNDDYLLELPIID